LGVAKSSSPANQQKQNSALKRGPAMLQTWLTRSDGTEHGAYYVHVRRLD
jgi:hypothetical protein